MKYLILVLVLALGAGCGTSDTSNTGGSAGTGGGGGTAGGGGAGGTDFSPNPPLEIGGERPSPVVIPRDYDPGTAYPLVIVLHGFGPFTGVIQSAFLGVTDMVELKDFVLVLPNGTLNEETGDRFWNGATFCCDPDDAVDDVGYLSGLIAEARQIYNIDTKRVYLIGHSNGGFMSFRMACEASELITAIVSLAGSTFADEADCTPATLPVSVLAVHGTADSTILYDGVEDAYPSAVDTVESFAAAAGCDAGAPTSIGNIDLVESVPGDETERVEYKTGCDPGVDAALWTIQDGSHIPNFYESGDTAFGDLATDWLLQHSR